MWPAGGRWAAGDGLLWRVGGLGQPGTPGFPRLLVSRGRVSREGGGSRALGTGPAAARLGPRGCFWSRSPCTSFAMISHTTDAGFSLFSLGPLGWSRGASFLRGVPPAVCLGWRRAGQGPGTPRSPRWRHGLFPGLGVAARPGYPGPHRDPFPERGLTAWRWVRLRPESTFSRISSLDPGA